MGRKLPIKVEERDSKYEAKRAPALEDYKQSELENEMKRALRKVEKRQTRLEKLIAQRAKEIRIRHTVKSILTLTKTEKSSIFDRAIELCNLFMASRARQDQPKRLGNLTRVVNKWILCACAVHRAAMEEGYGLTFSDLRQFVQSKKRFSAWKRRLMFVCSLRRFSISHCLKAYLTRFARIGVSDAEMHDVFALAEWLGDGVIVRLPGRAEHRSLWCLPEFLQSISHMPRVAETQTLTARVHTTTVAATLLHIVLDQRAESASKRKAIGRGKVITPPAPKKARISQSDMSSFLGVYLAGIVKCKRAVFELIECSYLQYRKM